jgi:RNA polymerase sigma-70 factor, ECF subfamily
VTPSEEEALCRELVPRVRAFALRRTRDVALAADVAQEVAVIVLQALRDQRVQDPARLSAFVLGVARNVITATRRGDRRRSALLEQFGPALVDTVAAVEDHRLDWPKVEACFDQLAPRARAVLALTFFADRSADEIGRELGVAAGNVRVVRHRALTQLQNCVGSPS